MGEKRCATCVMVPVYVMDIQVAQEKGVLDLNPRSDPVECVRPGRLELLPWVHLKYNVKSH